jgi:hypothetical protein
LIHCRGKDCQKLLRESCVSRTWKCPECSMTRLAQAREGYRDDADYLNAMISDSDSSEDEDLSDNDSSSNPSNNTGSAKAISSSPTEPESTYTRPVRRSNLNHCYRCECGCGATVKRNQLVTCCGTLCLKLLRPECCAPGCATYKCHECAGSRA